MNETDDVQRLVEAAWTGDRAAWERLLASSRGPLEAAFRPVLEARLKGVLELDDLLQETFARALASLGRFRWQGEGSFAAWLAGIARNIVLDAVRRTRPRAGLSLAQEIPSRDPSPSTAARREERRDRLEEALRGLRPDYRRAIVLTRLDGLSIEEAAASMGRSPNAVKKLLSRALMALRRSFGDTDSFSLPGRRLEAEKEGGKEDGHVD